MTISTGKDAGFYINVGTSSLLADVLWAYVGSIKDLTVDRSAEEIEFPCRNSGNTKQYLVGQLDYEVSLDIAHESPQQNLSAVVGLETLFQSTPWGLLEVAFTTRSPLHILVADGVINPNSGPLYNPNTALSSGLEVAVCGFEMTAYVTSFNWSQPLNEGQLDSITLRPSINGYPRCNPPVAPSLFYLDNTVACA